MDTEHPRSVKIGYAFAMVIAGIIGAIPVILLAVLACHFIPAYRDYLQWSYTGWRLAFIPFGIAGLAYGYLSDRD
jgi:hypothetical protein